MARATRLIFVAIVVALAGAGDALAAPRPSTTTFHRATVPGTGAAFAVSCSAGYAAVSGSTAKGGDVSETLGYPTGVRRWRFAFGGTLDGLSAKVSVAVRCVRVATIGERIRDGAPAARSLAPGEGWWGHATCPHGYSPMGLGTHFASSVATYVELRKALPVNGGYDFAVVNGTSPTDTRLVARCVNFVRAYRTTVTPTVAPGPGRFVRECGRHGIGLSTGWDLTDGSSAGVRVVGTSMTGPGHGSWSLLSAAPVPAFAPLVQLCLGVL